MKVYTKERLTTILNCLTDHGLENLKVGTQVSLTLITLNACFGSGQVTWCQDDIQLAVWSTPEPC